MDDSQRALPPDGVMAKLQEAITRHSGGNKEREAAKSSSQDEKSVEQYRGVPNGTGNRPDYASTITSSVRSPGIRIEEEMVVPPRS